MARDRGTPAHKTSRIRAVPITQDSSRIRAVPITLNPSATVEPERSKGTQSQSKIRAKQSARDKRSSAEAAQSGESAADAPGLQPGTKQRGRRNRRERKQRLARRDDAQQAQGQSDSRVHEESFANCPVCWGACTHSNGKCPCLAHLPADLLAEVLDLCGRYQRNYALTLIQRCWERSGKLPPEVPSVTRVRGSLYCCSCDGQDHSAGHCPDLSGLDSATRSSLMAAYRHGTCNGRTPGQIFREWEDGTESKKLPPCLICKSTHCFEACPHKGHMRQDEFVLIVAALRAGQPQTARGAWEAVQARTEQDAGGRDTFPKRRARKAIPIKLSSSPAPNAHDSGGAYAQGRQADLGAPKGAMSAQQQQLPKGALPSTAIASTQSDWSTANSSAASQSLWAPASSSKPYWHKALAARSGAQGGLSSCPPGGAFSSAVPAAGQSGAGHQAPYSAPRQPGYSEERVRHQHQQLQEIRGWVVVPQPYAAASPHAAASAGPAAARLLAAAGLGVNPGGRPGPLH